MGIELLDYVYLYVYYTCDDFETLLYGYKLILLYFQTLYH